jgi:6,7-dimethyl-8-ribityllumazine synthase
MTFVDSVQGFRIESNPPNIDLSSVSELLAIAGMRARSIDAMARAIKASTEVLVVYNDRDTLVGFGRLITDGSYYGTLWDIAVHPMFRKLGIGKVITARLLDKCRSLGLAMVGLFTARQNRQFYSSAGFVMLDDVHAMTLQLNSFERVGDMERELVGIVVTKVNSSISEAMLAAVQDEAAVLGVEIAAVSHVPGAYEIPLIADALLQNNDITSVVVLGFIERGDTQHGEVMAYTVSSSLFDSSVKYGKAIGYGIIGPGASLEQANQRKEPYARAAVRAAVASTKALRTVREHKQ